MTTELERLKTWMAEKDFDAKTMASALGITYSFVYQMHSDRRRISDGFKWLFSQAFGFDTARAIFDSSATKKEPHPLSEAISHPAQYAAHKTVAKARRAGKLLAASKYKCHACDDQSTQWHHPSYHPNDHLCVVPLCNSCHRKAHLGTLGVNFGVVPTRVGIIRIAIAGL